MLKCNYSCHTQAVEEDPSSRASRSEELCEIGLEFLLDPPEPGRLASPSSTMTANPRAACRPWAAAHFAAEVFASSMNFGLVAVIPEVIRRHPKFSSPRRFCAPDVKETSADGQFLRRCRNFAVMVSNISVKDTGRRPGIQNGLKAKSSAEFSAVIKIIKMAAKINLVP
jgi:hypothetical protein